jgi:hypothetical protein
MLDPAVQFRVSVWMCNPAECANLSVVFLARENTQIVEVSLNVLY